MAKREVPTVNEDLMDRLTLHDLRLQHVSNGTARRARKLLFAAHEDVMEQLQGRLERAARKGFDTGPVTTKRLRDLAAAFRRQTAALMPETRALIAGEAVEGAVDEVAYLGKLVTDTVPIDVSFLAPSAATIRNAALMTPFDGKTLAEWTTKLGRDTLARFNQQVRIGLIAGEDYRQIARRLRGTRNKGFRDGVLGWQRYEAETLARTATAHARAVVRDETFEENSDLLKGVRWSATLDTRTCLRCASLDGRFWRIGQTRPQVPLHFNCLPGNSLVTPVGRIAAASKRWSDGDLVVIRTAAGNVLSCTPNHPILTRAGFLPAQQLVVGDDVIRSGFGEGVLRGNSDGEDVPTAIEDIAEAFFSSPQVSTVPVPVAAEHFHGDGMDGDVAVVGTDGFLRDEFNVPLGQPGDELAFIRRMHSACALSGSGLEGEFGCARTAPASGNVGAQREAAAVGGAGVVHPDLLLLGSAADVNTTTAQNPVDGGSAAAELVSELLRHNSAEVLFDNVVSIDTRPYSGHVYNLQTESGMYVASNIVNHNCRCSLIPVTKSFRELGFDVDDLPPGKRAALGGEVPEDQTYAQWIKKQPSSVQLEALGRGRYERMKGGEGVGDFVNSRNRILTLKELRAKEAR